MSDQDAFERIGASFHDAVLDETLWPATSALIDAACGLQGNGLFVGAGPQDDIRVISSGFYYRGQRHDALEREYLTVYHPIDERVPRLRQLPDNHLVHVTSLYTTEELQTSPTYNELLARGGGQDSVNVRLAGLAGSHITWSTTDPVTPGGWSTPQVALLRGLLPHIRHFVRVRQTLAKAEAEGATSPALLNTTRVGVIQLDRRGQIMEANDRARDLLRRGDGLSDQDGLLRASLPTDHPRLERLIAGALPAARPAVGGSMLLHRAAVLPPFLVHVTPVSVRQPDFGSPRVAALVLLVEPGHQARIDPRLVAAILGLTPVESQVAVWLAEGRTVQEMAVLTGRQVNTVYYHLKQIYQKLGLARQADVVRLVLSIAEFV